MCLIIHQPRGLTLPRRTLESAAKRNADGFGLMTAASGALRIFRTLDPEEALALYYAHGAGRECVLHWRLTTHGRTDLENCHPFTPAPGVAVAHNGVLDVGTPHTGMSDTWHFVRYVLAPMLAADPQALKDPDTVAVLEGLTRGSRLAAMHADGTVTILHRRSGVEHQGAWYSNVYGWDAPAHLSTTARYGSSYGSSYGSGGSYGARYTPTLWEDDTPDAAPKHTAQPQDEADPLDALALACVDDGAAGAREWLERHPTDAVAVLLAHFQLDPADAAELVNDPPEEAAEWLAAVAADRMLDDAPTMPA